jgi:hypothetical protein
MKGSTFLFCVNEVGCCVATDGADGTDGKQGRRVGYGQKCRWHRLLPRADALIQHSDIYRRSSFHGSDFHGGIAAHGPRLLKMLFFDEGG